MLRQQVFPRWASAAGAALLLSAAEAVAAQPAPWLLHVSHRVDAAQTVRGQTQEPRRYTGLVGRQIDATSQAFWRHEYRFLDLPSVDGIAADPNGHVHRSAFGWRSQTQDRRLEFAPTVAVSSNALKDPKQLRTDDLRLAASIQQRIGELWWLGLHADDRFGRSRVYPGLAVEFQPAPGHEIRIGFPDAAWRWHLAPSVRSELVAAPDGGRWGVRDKSLQRRSDLRVRAWHLAWTVRWRPLPWFEAEASVGRTFGNELRYLLQDGSAARVDVPDRNDAGIAAFIRF